MAHTDGFVSKIEAVTFRLIPANARPTLTMLAYIPATRSAVFILEGSSGTLSLTRLSGFLGAPQHG